MDVWDQNLTQGYSQDDYHVSWSTDGDVGKLVNLITVELDQPWGPGIVFQSGLPNGNAIDDVTVTCTIDDINYPATNYGSPDDAARAVNFTIKVWEMTMTRRASGSKSPENDGSIPDYYGGGLLGPLQPGDNNGAVVGFHDVCEFV